MTPDPRPPVSDQTPTPNIVCRSCGNGHHRKYQRGEAMEPCPHCGSSALRFLVPGELSPAAAPAPTPEPPLSIADSDDPSPWADHPPTPSPVSPEDGDEPATWADLLTCERCGRPLEQPGALMFSPPNKAGMVRKHHICADCYLAGEGFTAASGAVS